MANETIEVSFAGTSQFLPASAPDFLGREWVFAELNQWLADPGNPRRFLLTGAPGSGKSAIARRLWDFSSGRAAPAPGAGLLHEGFLAAAHVCSARGDSMSLDPIYIASSLAVQLAARIPPFKMALLRSVAQGRSISAKADVGTMEAQAELTVLRIGTLVANGVGAEESFHRFVREPLQRIYDGGFRAPVTILFDGLDEALGQSGKVGIIQLLARMDNMPPEVRFILTSRQDQRVTDELSGAAGLVLTGAEHGEQNRADLRAYIDHRLTSDGPLSKVPLPGPRDAVIEAVSQAADDNFLYVRFLLDEVEKGRRALDDTTGLPEGLDELYGASLERVVKAGGRDWLRDYSPILGVLSVAMEPLGVAQISRYSGFDKVVTWNLLGDLEQFVEEAPLSAGAAAESKPYRLYHQSVIDFFRKPEIAGRQRSSRNRYQLDAATFHRRIAEDSLRRGAAYSTAWDRYGLRYVGGHLAAAARASEEPERTELALRLVALVEARAFQDAHTRRIDDFPALQADIERAVGACAAAGGAVLPLFRAVATFLDFRRTRVNPRCTFDLARAGQLDEAQRSLGLSAMENDWQAAILLLLAWIAADKNEAGARAVRDRIAAMGEPEVPVALLLAHLAAKLDKVPAPIPLMPRAPAEHVVQGIVQRIGAALTLTGGSSGMVEAGYGAMMDSGPPGGGPVELLDWKQSRFLAAFDGPVLVAFAAEHPAEGQEAIDSYLEAHTGYGYAHYRNGSLWALLPAILSHPDPVWARDTAERVALIALGGATPEPLQSLPMTLLALRARAGDAQAQADLAAKLADARKTVANVIDQREGDSWGTHKRLLVAAATASWVSRDKPLPGAPPPAEYFYRALDVPYGFAGFQVPAYLALAEASSLWGPFDFDMIEAFLNRAVSGAHNVRDAVLCARLTARVHAMRLQWWSEDARAGVGVGEVIGRFVEDPEAPEFLPLHLVGEIYGARVGAPLPPRMLGARTLRELAEHFSRPLSDVLRKNPSFSAEEPLAFGERVRVPEPGFRAWLAARLSAEVLVAPDLPQDERVALIQSLVPPALGSPINIDTVLARLLLATVPEDPADLDKIAASVETIVRPASAPPG